MDHTQITPLLGPESAVAKKTPARLVEKVTTLLPFCRYTGGKRRVMPAIDQIIRSTPDLPLLAEGQRYWEPMIGAGAPFAYWATRGLIPAGQAVLGDASPLMAALWRASIDEQGRTKAAEWLRSMPVDRETYDAVKKRVNDVVMAGFDSRIAPTDGVTCDWQLGASILYLIQCAYGGLLRTNGDGMFNVSFAKDAKKGSINITNMVELGTAAAAATGGAFRNDSYDVQLRDHKTGPQAGDLVYLDPPYLASSKTSNFSGYTPGSWGIEAHEELADCFRQLAARGVRVALSNADTEKVRELYAGESIQLHELSGHRANNRSVKKRPKRAELLITANI